MNIATISAVLLASLTAGSPLHPHVARQVQTLAAPCAKTYAVQEGQTCEDVAAANGITPADFKALNSMINEGCTNMEAGLEYCVGAGTDTTTATEGLTTATDAATDTATSGLVLGTQPAVTPTETFIEPTLPSESAIETLAIADTPIANPSDPLNRDWKGVSCDPKFTSELVNDPNPWTLWNDSGAEAAYNSLKSAYAAQSSVSFNTYLGRFFSLRPGLECDSVPNRNCEVTFDCEQKYTPAGYMIANSRAMVHTVFADIYDALNFAKSDLALQAGDFAKQLSPINVNIADQKKYKMMLDGIQMGLLVGLAPIFHGASGLGRFAWVQRNPNMVASAYDSAYGIIGTTMAFVKDGLESLSTLPVQNEMTKLMGESINRLLKDLSDTTTHIMNDPATLFTYIDKGISYEKTVQKKPIDMQVSMFKMVFASFLSWIWSTGSGQPYPVIMSNQGMTQSGSGCQSWTPPTGKAQDQRLAYNFPPELATSERVCVGGDAYWLVGVKADASRDVRECSAAKECGPPEPPPNDQITVSKLYGIDKLDGKSYGGLWRDEVVMSAVGSWTMNGKRNGWPAFDFDPTDSFGLSDAVSGNLGTMTGIINIPVCSFLEIVATIQDDPDNTKNNPNFPCPA